MSRESDNARMKIGQLLKDVRALKGWDRERLAQESRLKIEVIINLEHGVVNPTRSDFNIILKKLAPPPEILEIAGRLLGMIHPRKRVKFHLHPSILQKRNHRR